VGAWAQTVNGIAAAMPPVQGTGRVPGAEALVDNAFDVAEKLLAGQRQFVRNLIAAASPAITPPTS
jgi:hypothetical protein